MFSGSLPLMCSLWASCMGSDGGLLFSCFVPKALWSSELWCIGLVYSLWSIVVEFTEVINCNDQQPRTKGPLDPPVAAFECLKLWLLLGKIQLLVKWRVVKQRHCFSVKISEPCSWRLKLIVNHPRVVKIRLPFCCGIQIKIFWRMYYTLFCTHNALQSGLKQFTIVLIDRKSYIEFIYIEFRILELAEHF